jgi:hypothetical protein
MVEPVKPPHPASDPSGPEGASNHPKGPPPQYGESTGKPMTFLGMKFTGPEAEKFWDVLMQQINSQIQREQARALKALRKLRKSTSNDDD